MKILLPEDEQSVNFISPIKKKIHSTITQYVFPYNSYLLSFPVTNIYHPQINDIIIVQAINVTSDFIICNIDCHNVIQHSKDQSFHYFYKSSIFSQKYTFLLSLSFYNTTKRNKPKINNGDFILARIAKINGNSIMINCNEERLGILQKLVNEHAITYELSHNMINDTSKKYIHHIFKVKPYVIRSMYISNFKLNIDAFVAIGLNGYLYIAAKNGLIIEKVYNKLMAEYE